MRERVWRKSSYSGNSGGDCVEVAVSRQCVGVRDSKNTTGPTLEFPAAQWWRFVAAR